MKRKILKVLGVAAIAFLMACLVLFLFLYLLDKDSKEYVKQLEQEEQINLEENSKLKGNEIAAIYAVQQLKKHIKNPHSMNIFSLSYICLSVDNGVADYIIRIEYSAENDIGGTVEEIMYYEFKAAMYDYLAEENKDLIEIDKDNCNFITMGMLKNQYDKEFEKENYIIDIETVLNNIDIDISELNKLKE